MTAASAWMMTDRTGDGLEITLSGDWTIDNAGKIDSGIAALDPDITRSFTIDAGQIGRMDTAGGR